VTTALDRSDIQGFVLHGYRMRHAAYLFHRFRDARAARGWLADLVDSITTAVDWDVAPPWCANVGLTYPGLAALGLPTESLGSFPQDFRQSPGRDVLFRAGSGDCPVSSPCAVATTSSARALPPCASWPPHVRVLRPTARRAP